MITYHRKVKFASCISAILHVSQIAQDAWFVGWGLNLILVYACILGAFGHETPSLPKVSYLDDVTEFSTTQLTKIALDFPSIFSGVSEGIKVIT